LRGGYFTFKTDYIQPFPVPEIIPQIIYEKVLNAVNNIIEMKAIDVNLDISKSEKIIDECIYSLYNLNKEDIEIVETLNIS